MAPVTETTAAASSRDLPPGDSNAAQVRKVSRWTDVVNASVVTAALLAIAVLWPTAAWNRLGELRRSTLGYQLRPEDPALVITGLLLVGVVVTVIASRRPLRHYAPIREAQTGFRSLVEQSYFGQGHYAGWTHSHPQASLGNLVQPDVDELGEFGDVTDVDMAGRVAQRAPVESKVASVGVSASTTSDRLTVPTVDFVVTHRDSWRRIAETALGDPSRAGEIRAMNLGREVEPGVIVTEALPLRSGWVLLVPQT